MPQILTTKAQIMCPHGGKGTMDAGVPFWDIQGGKALVEGDSGVVAGCALIQLPCVSYTLRSMNLNATTLMGRKVILVTDFNQTNTGMPLTMVETHQTFDNSTPAPLPPGGADTGLSEELADLIKPVVIGMPPSLAFSITTMQPAVAAINFTLVSDHPLKWILTLIGGAPVKSIDLTRVTFPGLTIIPPSGEWTTPVLPVTVTLTAAYMASLGPGPHHFYMTGVSQRGLSSTSEVILQVSP